MSLGRRLFDLARTEFGDMLRRLRHPSHEHPTLEGWPNETPFEKPSSSRSTPDVPENVARWYGNLELPIGAPANEVKAAYRRLVRRYHPDHHARDPGRAAIATKLSLELREAYEGLLTYLASVSSG